MTIKLNEKEYPFKFSFSAIRKLEKQTGKSTTELSQELKDSLDAGKIDFDLALNICHLGLVGGGSELTLDEVEKILDEGAGIDIGNILSAYFKNITEYFTKNLPNEASQTT